MTPFIRSNDFAAFGGDDFKASAIIPITTGDVLARITSGAEAGLYAPFDLSATDGRQTLANILGVSAIRTTGADPTGALARLLPNQPDNMFTFFQRGSACDANSGFIRDGTGTRITLNQEAGLTTKNYLAGRQFYFIN